MDIVHHSHGHDINWLVDGPIGPLVDAFKQHVSGRRDADIPSRAICAASRTWRSGCVAGVCGCNGSAKQYRAPESSSGSCRHCNHAESLRTPMSCRHRAGGIPVTSPVHSCDRRIGVAMESST